MIGSARPSSAPKLQVNGDPVDHALVERRPIASVRIGANRIVVHFLQDGGAGRLAERQHGVVPGGDQPLDGSVRHQADEAAGIEIRGDQAVLTLTQAEQRHVVDQSLGVCPFLAPDKSRVDGGIFWMKPSCGESAHTKFVYRQFASLDEVSVLSRRPGDEGGVIAGRLNRIRHPEVERAPGRRQRTVANVEHRRAS